MKIQFISKQPNCCPHTSQFRKLLYKFKKGCEVDVILNSEEMDFEKIIFEHHVPYKRLTRKLEEVCMWQTLANT
jgi:hypothetical protein